MFKLLKKMAGRRTKAKSVNVKDTLTEQEKSKGQLVSLELSENIKLMKKLYHVPENSDVKWREIELGGSGKEAALFFISSITDIPIVSENVIKPLIMNENEDAKVKDIVYTESVTIKSNVREVILEINNGSVAIFIQGDSQAYIVPCAKFQGRSIEKAENEVLIKGPKESFTEQGMANLSLIRKRIRNEQLIVENMTISARSKNQLYILYINNIVDDQLLTNIKERISSLDVASIQNLSLLEQYIEERELSLFPSLLYTERPDRAVSFLENGHVVLLMENSPDSIVLPATFWAFFHTSEEHYLRFVFGNFSRGLRIIALFISLFISAIYVAITTYHSEMIPADLLLAIAGTREKVPFPALFEILIMEASFELIREAGLRVPNPMGPTIGIVGALILGQAAVEANIISPIVIIVVALSGLSSFAISDISLNFAVRIIRILSIIAAGMFGIYGMTALFIAGLFYMVSLKSFGVPFLAPMSPHYNSSGDTIFRKTLSRETFRPGYLKPVDIKKKSNGAAK